MSDSNPSPAEHDAPTIVSAIRDAIPTSRHAAMLFDMVRSDLGEDAVLATAAGQTKLWLFRKDGEGVVVPSPLLSMSTKGRLGWIVPLAGPAEAPPRPGEGPALRGLGPGEIVLHDGSQKVTVTYGDDGRWFETSRGTRIDSFGGAMTALADGSANPVDLLASFVTGLDIGRHGPGRVLYPVPLPGGVAVAWLQGMYAIRDALFDGRLPAGETWVVADGIAGTALAWGATREEALEAWRAEVLRVQPRHVKPEPLPESLGPDGVETLDAGPNEFGVRVTFRGSQADLEWPEPTLANTPAVVIPIEAAPDASHSFGSWARLLGWQGATVPTLRREDPGGLTLVGRRLAAAVDLDGIDRQVDPVVTTEMPPPWPGEERPPYDCCWATYRLVDEETGEPVPARQVETHWGWGLSGREFDGEALEWFLLRQRWHGAG